MNPMRRCPGRPPGQRKSRTVKPAARPQLHRFDSTVLRPAPGRTAILLPSSQSLEMGVTDRPHRRLVHRPIRPGSPWLAGFATPAIWRDSGVLPAAWRRTYLISDWPGSSSQAKRARPGTESLRAGSQCGDNLSPTVDGVRGSRCGRSQPPRRSAADTPLRLPVRGPPR